HAAWPAHLDIDGGRAPPQAEVKAGIALGEIARPAARLVGLDHSAPGDPHTGAEAVAVRPAPHQAELQPGEGVAAIVAQELRWLVVGADEDVGGAVVVEIAPRSPTSHTPSQERRPGAAAHLLERPVPLVVEKEGTLGERDRALEALDIRLRVAIGDEGVRPA